MIDYVNLNDEDFTVNCYLQSVREQEPHYHDDHAVLIFVLKGKTKLHAGGLHKEIKKGELAFVSPGEVHYTDEEVDNEILVAYIKAGGKDYVKSMVCSEDAHVELKIQLLSLLYFYYMDELIEENDFEYACNRIADKTDQLFGISDQLLSKYLHENHRKDLKVKSVGEHFKTSGKSVTASLKRNGAGGFSEYLTYIRCKDADKIILESNMQIKRVAVMAGFSSERSFIRDYFAYAGRTPLQQRKYYQEKKKYRFNRVKMFNAYYIISVIPQYLGELQLNRMLENIKKL